MGAKYTVEIDLIADAKITEAFQKIEASISKVSGEIRHATDGVKSMANAAGKAGRGFKKTEVAADKAGRGILARFRHTMHALRGISKKETKKMANDWYKYRYRVRQAMRGISHKLRVGALLGGGYFGGIAKLLVGAGIKADTEKSGLAVLLQGSSKSLGGKYKGFDEALAKATELRKTFRTMAVSSPVTASGIVESFSRILPLASKAGVSIKSMGEMARNLATMDKITGRDQGIAARDLRDLMSGKFIKSQIQTQVLRANGQAIVDLVNASKHKEAFNLAKKVLAIDPKALEHFKNTLGGQLATLKDKWQQLRETVARPLNAALSKMFIRFMKWYEAHADEINKKAEAFGTELGDWFANTDWEGLATSIGNVAKGVDSVAQFFGGWGDALAIFMGAWLTLDLAAGLAAIGGLLSTSIGLTKAFAVALGLVKDAEVAAAAAAAGAGAAQGAGAAAGAMSVGAIDLGILGGVTAATVGLVAALTAATIGVLLWPDQMKAGFISMFDTIGQWFGAKPLRDNSKDVSLESKDPEKVKQAAAIWAWNHNVSPKVFKQIVGLEISAPEGFSVHVKHEKADLNKGTGHTLVPLTQSLML